MNNEMPEDGEEEPEIECPECGDVCAERDGACGRCLQLGIDNYQESVNDAWLDAVRGS